jgi:peptide-methionine (R)-S-oxide reductase
LEGIMSDKTIKKSEAEWQKELDPLQHHVLRQHGTERPFTSPLNNEKRTGVFRCAGCGEPLFDSNTKYESGSGWPSFWAAKDNAVDTSSDASHGMIRTEVTCAKCGGHLGHLFPDGPRPTGDRYCMNGAALKFEEKK